MFSRLFRRKAPIFLQLRESILALKPKDLPPEFQTAPVLGLVIDMGMPNGTATQVCVIDGTASLYFDKGGGIIGAGQHDAVRKKLLAALESAKRFVSQLAPSNQIPLPRSGDYTLTVITPHGLRTATARARDLGEGLHPLSPLFRAADDVITEMRRVSPGA